MSATSRREVTERGLDDNSSGVAVDTLLTWAHDIESAVVSANLDENGVDRDFVRLNTPVVYDRERNALVCTVQDDCDDFWDVELFLERSEEKRFFWEQDGSTNREQFFGFWLKVASGSSSVQVRDHAYYGSVDIRTNLPSMLEVFDYADDELDHECCPCVR